MKDDPTEAPKLSEDGARLLANVLDKRAADRHDTLSARRNARRREHDELRIPPDRNENPHFPRERQSRSTTPGEVVQYSVVEEEPESESRSWLVLTGFCAVLIFCVFLVTTLDRQPAQVESGTAAQALVETDDSELVEEDVEPVAAADDSLQDSPVEESVVSDSADDVDDADDAADAQGESAETFAAVVEDVDVDVAGLQESAVIEPTIGESRAAASDFEITVYDSTSEAEVASFALRFQNLGADGDIPTEDIMVQVENEEGEVAQTFVRFLHPSVPVGSNALASVRAEDLVEGDQFVAVWLDGVQIARIALRN